MNHSVETPPGPSPNSPSLLFGYQCRSGKFIRLANRIEKIDSVARIESKLFCPNWNALDRTRPDSLRTCRRPARTHRTLSETQVIDPPMSRRCLQTCRSLSLVGPSLVEFRQNRKQRCRLRYILFPCIFYCLVTIIIVDMSVTVTISQ